jgi:hypothetical protein
VFPTGLATVRINREKDTGEYWEPNIWIVHQVSSEAGVSHPQREHPRTIAPA